MTIRMIVASLATSPERPVSIRMARSLKIELTPALVRQNSASLHLLARSQQRRFPYRTHVDGRLIEVDRGVFSPQHFSGWRFFHRHFPRVRGRVLDMGCGTGIGALAWLDHGASSVLAVDITEEAVRNARRNAKRFAPHVVQCLKSDLFRRISPDERFQIIYWNYPFLQQPDSYHYESPLERGLFDPGYRLLARFLYGCRKRLLPGGSIVLGWGETAFDACLQFLVRKLGFRMRLLASSKLPEMRFELYEIRPSSNRLHADSPRQSRLRYGKTKPRNAISC